MTEFRLGTKMEGESVQPGTYVRIYYAHMNIRVNEELFNAAYEFYDVELNFEIPRASTLSDIGVLRLDFIRAAMETASHSLEELENQGQYILDRSVFEGIVQVNDPTQANIRDSIGEYAVTAVVMHHVLQFRRSYNGNIIVMRILPSRQETSYMQRHCWLNRLQDATPTRPDDACSVCLES